MSKKLKKLDLSNNTQLDYNNLKLPKNISYLVLDNTNFTNNNLSVLAYVVPTMFGIITLCLIHILCRFSTIDVFKKCTMDISKTDYVMKNLKIFFVVVILVSIFYSFTSLFISVNLDSQSVQISTMEYTKIFSPEHSKL